MRTSQAPGITQGGAKGLGSRYSPGTSLRQGDMKMRTIQASTIRQGGAKGLCSRYSLGTSSMQGDRRMRTSKQINIQWPGPACGDCIAPAGRG